MSRASSPTASTSRPSSGTPRNRGRCPPIVAAEIERLDRAELLILQYPMWWHLPPAMLKGWFDRVLIFGEVYASQKRFEKGRFVGKRAMLSVTVGTSAETYGFDGRSGDIDLLLWPVNFTLAYVGYSRACALRRLRRRGRPQIFGRLRGGGAAEARGSRTSMPRSGVWISAPVVPFNRMAEWGADGRITAEAEIHSPFIRRKQHLDLE